MAISTPEEKKWRESIPLGEDYVPKLTPQLSTPRTEAARRKFVEAWNEWRYRGSFSNAMARDNARKSFYAEVGRAALGDAVDDADHEREPDGAWRER